MPDPNQQQSMELLMLNKPGPQRYQPEAPNADRLQANIAYGKQLGTSLAGLFKKPTEDQ